MTKVTPLEVRSIAWAGSSLPQGDVTGPTQTEMGSLSADQN